MNTRKLSSRKRIALVAHDNMKDDIIEWAIYNKAALSKHRLYATGTTGTLLETALDQSITKFLSGPLGGDQQIGASIAEGKIDALIFFGTRWRHSRMIPILRPCYVLLPPGIYLRPVTGLQQIFY